MAFIYSKILFMVNLGSIAGTYNNFEILQIEIYANQKACVIETLISQYLYSRHRQTAIIRILSFCFPTQQALQIGM